MAWDAITDWASGAADTVGNFFTGGGGQAAANAGEAMAQSQLGGGGGALGVAGDLFSGAASFAGNAFDWMGKYPEAANLLGGVAMGVGQYYSAEQDREQRARDNRLDRELQRELADERIAAQQIVPGEFGSGYGSYRGSVTQGLISNGMLASDREAV